MSRLGVENRREALLVLVGITAKRAARRHLERFFAQRGGYDVFVPALPFRKGVRNTAAWLRRYLDETVRPARYHAVHGIAYIGGGMVLRCLGPRPSPINGRLVLFRGPVQERVPAALVGRLGRLLAGVVGGRAVLDLAAGWPAALPLPGGSMAQGLIIETGRSRLARGLGIDPAGIPPEAWDADRLLPGAADVLRIPESHDQVFTSASVLGAALCFIRTGAFPHASPEGKAAP